MKPDKPVFVALDFETSGPQGHYACAIGMARIENNAIVGEYYSTIKPPSKDIWYTRVHGLTWRDLKDSPTFPEIWPEIEAFIAGANFFIAHCASFDRKVLSSCCRFFDCEYPGIPFLDTCKGARRAYGLAHNRLSDVCEHLDIALNHHHAGSDALACALIFLDLDNCGLTLENLIIK